jgi:hypothetical protein
MKYKNTDGTSKFSEFPSFLFNDSTLYCFYLFPHCTCYRVFTNCVLFFFFFYGLFSGPAHILCLIVASGWNKERCIPEILLCLLSKMGSCSLLFQGVIIHLHCLLNSSVQIYINTYNLTLSIWLSKASLQEDLCFPDKYQGKYDVIYNPLGINIIVFCTQSPFILFFFFEVPTATQIWLPRVIYDVDRAG